MDPQVVLQAIATLQAPSATIEQKRQANQYLEQLKRGDVHTALSVFGSLTASNMPMETQIVGYTVLSDLIVKNRWKELTEQEHAHVSQLAFNNVGIVISQGRAAWPVKGKAAALLSAVVRQQGTDAYTSVVPQLIARAPEGPTHAEMACTLLHFISEDLTVFDTCNNEGKRTFLSALTNSVNNVFPFLCEMLQQHFVSAVSAQQAGQTEQLAAHSAVITSSLKALATWVEWTPMARIASSNVLDACAFFLNTPEFRLLGLDVLKQISGRKRTTESWEEYAGLFGRVAGALLTKCGELGLAAAPGQMPAKLSEELGPDGELEEFGRRVAAIAVALAEGHARALEHAGCRLQLLQLLLSLTAHPYLLLSTTTLHLWAQVMRDALPPSHAAAQGAVAGMAVSRPGSPAPLILSQVSGLSSPRGGQAGAAAGPGSGPTPDTPKGPPSVLPVPLEACQALMSVMVQILARVVPSAQEASSASADPKAAGMPSYFDTPQEWKDFCVCTRNQVKAVLRTAGQLSPEQALALGRAVVQAGLAGAAPGAAAVATPQAVAALETAVHVLEAVTLPVFDVAAAASAAGATAGAAGLAPAAPAEAGPEVDPKALLDEVEGLLGALMSARFPDAHLVTLHARGLEAFARLLVLRPERTAPLVAAALDIMATIHLEAPGQEPPPPRVGREWKSGFEARLAMANVVVNLAKAAPSAFVPHLVPLADRVVADWAAGRLREGERVLLWEGLLTAASAGPPALLDQMVNWLLAPLAAEWQTDAWRARFASPAAFAQVYMPIESSSGSTVVLGGRAARWALYHQLTLMERALRRVVPAQGSGAGATQDALAPAHPLAPHLAWMVPGLAAVVGMYHSIAAADVAKTLGPLQGLSEMDDIEKAVRLGEDVDAKRRGDSGDARCVAGSAVADARYFMRGIRESSTMALSLAASNVGGVALWGSPQLAQAVLAGVGTQIESVDHNHMRLLLRHVASIYTSRCPPQYHSTWVTPMCALLLPHMASRLSNAWQAAAAANNNGAVPGTTPTASAAGGDKEGAAKQTADEVVNDILVRELTREHLAWLNVMTLPPKGTASSQSPTMRASLSGAATVQLQAPPNAAGASSSQAGAAAAPEAPSVLELALINAGEMAGAQALAGTAVSALCWPDADGANKATNVCRFLVSLGQRLPALEPFVCGPLLSCGLLSLTMVHTATIQAEILQLLRALLAAYLPRPQGGALARATLSNTLKLGPDVIASFETQFSTVGAEKDKRNLIKTLVAQAGDDEVRKLLASVSKIQPAGAMGGTAAAAVAGQRTQASKKAAPNQADADAALSNWMFNAIFS